MEDPTHLQTQFLCTDDRFSIPESQFSIPATVTRVELNELVNQIATPPSGSTSPQNEDQPLQKPRSFDFLIRGQLLTGSLGDHVTQHQLSTEGVVEVECIPREAPPTLEREFEHKDWVSAVHCHKDLILTGCYDHSVRIWTTKGELVCVAEEHTAPVKSVRWIAADVSSDEWLFLSASQDQLVLLWRLTRSPGLGGGAQGHVTLLHRCKGHARSVEGITVSPDRSKFCSVSWDSFLKVWSAVPDSNPLDEAEQESDLPSKKPRTDPAHHPATTRTPLATFQGHRNAVTAVVWGVGLSDDIITGGWDNCIKIWDLETLGEKATLNGSKAVHSVDVCGTQQLVASGSSDKYIRLWDTRQTEACMVNSTLSSHTGWVVTVRWSPSNPHHLLSGSYDSSLRLWDTRSCKKPLYSIAAHEGKVLCSDWSLPQVLASGGTDNKLRTYSL